MGQWAHFDKTGITPLSGHTWGEMPAGKPTMENGTARGGTASGIVLAADESVIVDAYKDLQIALLAGPGAGDHRTISAYSGGSAKAAQVGTPWSATPTTSTTYRIFKAVKFGVLNLGPRPLNAQVRIEQKDDNDGHVMALLALDTSGTLSPPCSVQAAVTAGGGAWPTTGVVYYRLTAVNAKGETVGSLEVPVTIAAVTETVVLSFTPPVGATAIKVFRTTAAGNYTSTPLRATLGGTATSYSDTGAAGTAGAFPAENTTGGGAPDYGEPPATLGQTPLSLGTVQVGEMRFYWVNVFVPNGTPEEGNDREFYVTLAEV